MTYPFRLRSASATTGTGAYAFTGTPFGGGIAAGTGLIFTATDRTSGAWESGRGTLQVDGSLPRTTITARSDGGTGAISWSAGTRDVAVTVSGAVSASYTDAQEMPAEQVARAAGDATNAAAIAAEATTARAAEVTLTTNLTTEATARAAGDATNAAAIALKANTAALGTIASQAASAVAITGGTIDSTTIGGTTPAVGTFSGIRGKGGSISVAGTSGASTRLVDARYSVFGAISADDGSGHRAHNALTITGDTASSSSAVSGLMISHAVGGGSASGGRNGMTVDMQVVGALNYGGGSANDIVAYMTESYASIGHGGTGGGDPANYRGTLFGGNDNIWLQTAATNYRGLYGREIDVGVGTGCTTYAKIGLFVVKSSIDAVQADGDDCAIAVSQQGASGTAFKRGIQFGATWGYWPFGTSSTLIGVQQVQYPSVGATPSAALGIDFTTVSFATNAIATPGFAVDPAGLVTAAGSKSGTLQTVTSMSRPSGGSYQFVPTVTVAAPVGGGVRATAVVDTMGLSTLLSSGGGIVTAGSGYTANDVLTIPNSGSAQIKVTTVDGSGAVTAAAAFAQGTLPATAFISNPVSVTGGTGTGATFNVAWVVKTYRVTNGGGPYFSVPTVTVQTSSGGTATATAVLGSATGDYQVAAGTTTLTVNASGGTVLASGPIGSSTYVVGGVQANMSAAGTTQGTATVLTCAFNEVITATSNQGVIMPSTVGAEIVVWNTTAVSIKVYPPSGWSIDSGSTNAAVTLTTGTKGRWIALSTSRYRSA
jgi:hypothetical protein